MRRWISATCLVAVGLALAACSGTDAINLNQQNQGETATPTGDTSAAGAPGAGSTGAGVQVDQQQAAAAIAAARVHFAAAVGTTAEALRPLQDTLNQRARQRGLTIETADQATLVVNGYFSTVAEERQTIVIYVWDVADKSGNRLHRIQGQERVSGTGNGWDAVDEATVTRIGQRTIDELADWLSRGRS